MKTKLSRRKRYQIVVLIILASLISRLLVSLNVNAASWPDSESYIDIAKSLASGHGYAYESPTTIAPEYWAPLYPLFMAIIYRLSGNSNIAVQLVQCLLGMVSCLLLYAIGERLFNEWIGLIAAALSAVYPFLVYISSMLLTEQLFVLLLLLAIYLLVRSRDDLGYAFILGAGISLGLGALTRPAMLAFFPFCAVYLLLSNGIVQFKRHLVAACILLICAFLTIFPWTIRNYIKHREFILISTAAGRNLWLGNNDLAGASDRTATLVPVPDEIQHSLSELSTPKSIDNFYRKMAIRWIRENPTEFLNLYFLKFLNFWRVTPDYVTIVHKQKWINLTCIAILVPLYLLSFLGIWKNRHRWKDHLIFYCALLSFPIGLSLFITSFRFRIPLDPILLLFSASALYYILPHKGEDQLLPPERQC